MLLRLSCSLCSSVCMKHRIPQCSEKTVFPFPFTRIHRLTANEKDFSLTLEMTVRESGILALLPSPCRRALVRGYGSPSFLWKEVPRRGGDWLTQRNKKEWVRNIFSSSARAKPRDLYCTAAICTHAPSRKRHRGASFFDFPSLTIYKSARRIPSLRSG